MLMLRFFLKMIANSFQLLDEAQLEFLRETVKKIGVPKVLSGKWLPDKHSLKPVTSVLLWLDLNAGHKAYGDAVNLWFGPYDGPEFSVKQMQPAAADCQQMTLTLTVNAPNAWMSVCRLKSGGFHGPHSTRWSQMIIIPRKNIFFLSS